MCRRLKPSQVPVWGRRSATHIPEALERCQEGQKGVVALESLHRLRVWRLQTISPVAKRLVKKRRIVGRYRLQVASRRPQFSVQWDLIL